MNRRQLLSLVGAAGCGAIVAAAALPGWGTKRQPENSIMRDTQSKLLDPIPQSEDEWKRILTPEQFRVLRRKGTERAFSGEYSSSKKHGVYRCAGCGQTLFSSDHKFDSGTGWPSFWQPIEESHVATEADNGFFTSRTEVLCNRCRGHLGHVFNDGPPPTGLRYCINSVALKLDETS